MTDNDRDSTVYDSKGTELKVGMRVITYPIPPLTTYYGTITEITDIDGDYDDELGRAVLIPPYVTVKWDKNDTTIYKASAKAPKYMYDPAWGRDFEIEDILKCP